VTTIEGLQEAVAKVASGVGTSVVGVAGRRSAGSGVVVAPGRVLTNAHNLWRVEEGITVTFADGRTAEGKPAGIDADADVAVLEVETGDAAPVPWNGATEPGIGAPVFAVANPGGRGLRVTFGMVSGTERSFRGPRGRRIAGSIEHTAPLLPGSSGGPVVDADGNLLGIPADAALRQRVDALARGEAPRRLKLGVAVAPTEVARRLRRAVGLAEADGLLVRGVEDDSPAARAGVQGGDLITSAGGKELRTADDLYAALDVAVAEKTLDLKILRGAEELSVTVSFQE
jgi:S1-C subfamily serine protease